MTKPFIFLSKRSGAWAPRKTISAIRSSRSAPTHRLKMARPRALLLFATALLAPASLAHGQTILVGPGETATIPGTYATGTYYGGAVDLEGTLIKDGSLDNESGGTLTNESGSNITNDGTLNNRGNLLEFGTIDNSDPLTNNGSFQNDEDGTLANEVGGTVIPPFLTGLIGRIYAASFSFWAGVMPPMPIFGRSLLYVQSHFVA
jgi:hypothetical protein